MRDNVRFLIDLADRVLTMPHFSLDGYGGRETRDRRRHEAASLLRESILEIEARLVAGERFLGYTLWSESQEAREMRRADPERYERAIDVWIGLLGKYERLCDELARYGVGHEYDPSRYYPHEYECTI